jgi:hypothetical protein
MFEEGTNSEVTSAVLSISPYSFEKIIEATKTRVIELLTFYEKNFGNLDKFDIDLDRYSSEEMEQVKSATDSIINGENVKNIYIVNSKIKNSNIGKDNSASKESKTQINPTINFPEKESLAKKIIHFFCRKK